MNKGNISGIEKIIKHLKQRDEEVTRLRESMRGLQSDRIQECINAIIKSYEQSTIIDQVTNVRKENNIEDYRYRSIGLYQAIGKEKFLASNYYWEPYFSDVGRAIARGERKYLHKRIGHRVTGVRETISRSNPNFSILTDYIKHLGRNNLDPDTILAPIRIFVDFVKSFGSSIDWTHGRPEQLLIEDCRLKVFWSHKYAQLNSFLIFNSKAGTWHVLKDKDTEKTITIAIGESEKSINKIVYIVETLAYYEITHQDAFVRINLSP